jgi:putative RecB family exonuclease
MSATIATDAAPTRMVWSATRLKSLLLCPRQFRYSYIDLIPAVPTAPLVFGRVLHEALCFLHERQMETRELPTIRDALGRFDGLWGRALEAEQPFFRPGASTPDGYTATGHEVLRAFVKAHESARPPLMVELAFEVSAGAHSLCGIIDRVDEGDNGLVIVDYKSGQRKPPLTEVERDLQLTLYAFAARQVLGQPVEKVVYYHLRDGSELTATRGESDFDWLLDTVLPHAAQTLERAEFPPHVGYWCAWCDFREVCQLERQREAHQAQVKEGEPTWPTPQR